MHCWIRAIKRSRTGILIIYVAGSAPGAPVAVDIDDKDEIIFLGTNRGDGTVPWESGILPELEKDRTYYMDVPHGDLANHKDSLQPFMTC